MARRASFIITASPLGEEEAVPSGRGAKGVAVPPWKRREAGGAGRPQRPERAPVTTRISGLSCGRESLSVIVCTTHSDEHAAKHGARSGMDQATTRSGSTTPWPSSQTLRTESSRPVM